MGKAFPGVQALDAAHLRLEPGTIHALLGENGAGKSTLIKIITGVYSPDEGTLAIGGETVTLSSPHDASRRGIAVVYQERNLVPEFSVEENITLNDPPRRLGVIDRAARRAQATRALDILGIQLDLDTQVKLLSPAQMQLVEIAKALVIDTRVLLLDEPTASLTSTESERLFAVVRRLRDAGTAVLFVSHKLEEVYELCDTVTVLRDGKVVLDGAPLSTVTQVEIVNLMVGRQFAAREAKVRAVDRTGTPAFELRAVATELGHADASFVVHQGEILGLYGLVGAGRSELLRSVIGLHRVTGGEVLVKGKAVRIRDMRSALRDFGIGYVTENRKEEGLFLDFAVKRNVAVTIWHELASRFGLLSPGAEDPITSSYVERLDIKISDLGQLAGTLSGGNQQKVSVSKWLAANTSILIIDEPTVGVDVRTKAAFHDLITELADKGLTIVLISSDLAEMVSLADRVCVMRAYRVIAEMDDTKRYDQMSVRIMAAIHGAAEAAAEAAGEADGTEITPAEG
jgi:ribose transport system ATP-binding protein